jgi:hypothetical protein
MWDLGALVGNWGETQFAFYRYVNRDQRVINFQAYVIPKAPLKRLKMPLRRDFNYQAHVTDAQLRYLP